jgi:hypothetical protein
MNVILNPRTLDFSLHVERKPECLVHRNAVACHTPRACQRSSPAENTYSKPSVLQSIEGNLSLTARTVLHRRRTAEKDDHNITHEQPLR